MNKRVLSAVVTSMALVLALSGCGSSKKDDEAKTPDASSAAIATTMKIGAIFDETTHKAFNLNPNSLQVDPVFTQNGFVWIEGVAVDKSTPASTALPEAVKDFTINYQSSDGKTKWSKPVKIGGSQTRLARTFWMGTEYVSLIQVNKDKSKSTNPLSNESADDNLVIQSFLTKDGNSSSKPLSIPVDMKKGDLRGILQSDTSNNLIIITDSEKSKTSVLNPELDRLVYETSTTADEDNSIPSIFTSNSEESITTHQEYGRTKLNGLFSGGWNNDNVTPVSSNGESIVAYTLTKDKDKLTSFLLDSESGEVQSSAECDTTSNMNSSNNKRLVQSPNGKFIFSNGFIFESGGGATCLYDTDTTVGVAITAITGSGIAFGVSSQGKIVQFDATGKTEPTLVDSAEVTPVTVSDTNYALFAKIDTGSNSAGELIKGASGVTHIEVAKIK